MAVSGISSMYPKFRMSGLATGLDTDQMISDLMRVERMPIDKLSQKRQLAEWKRDDYRSITTLLKGFQSSFFDVLNPSSNMRSSSVYGKYTSSVVTEAGVPDSSVVTVVGGSEISALEHTITVESIATAANATSTDRVSKSLTGSAVTNIEINDYNNSFKFTLNGDTKVITLPNGTYADANAILGNGSDGLLKQKIKEAFSGADVVVNGTALQFISSNPANTTDVISISSNPLADNLMSTLGINSDGVGSVLTFPLSIAAGRKIALSIEENGTSRIKEIEWPVAANFNDSATLAVDIQSKVDAAFGPGKLTVSGADGKLSFTTGAGVESLKISNSTKNNKTVEFLGFSSGDSNKISLSDTLDKVSSKLSSGVIIFNNDELTLTINGTVIKAKKTDTLSSLISKVNNSAANVTLNYSSFTDTFTLESKQTGEGTITLNDNGSNFFANTKLTVVNAGQNASFILDDQAAERATNTFSIDGVTYTLKKADPGNLRTITLTQDPDTVYDSIKAFVDKYNEVISTINSKLSEERSRDYVPLTSEQKEAMSEDEIERWETKAKEGLLKNDSILSRITNSMRRAMNDVISEISGGLSSIGITTGIYTEKGKLNIDEKTLKEAIKNNPEKVKSIFSKESSIGYSPNLNASDRATRYSENGIVNRIYDILQDNIRTIRDTNGNKGILLEKAGMVGDASEITNLIYKEISDYDERIAELNKKLINKENNYYKKFAALEKAISEMNNQSSWLTSQFSQG